MSTGMPELGSKISLISKADIRYEGRLYTVDPQECTIALSSVRSFGTEDRDTQFQIAPQSQIYDYILFRGSDIKDIRVVNSNLPHPNDPAIMQVQLPNGQHLMPHFPISGVNAAPPTQHGGLGSGYGNPFGAMSGNNAAALASGSSGSNATGSNGNQQQIGSGVAGMPPGPPFIMDMLTGASRSTTPISMISRKSPSTDMGVQVNTASQQQQQQQQQASNQQSNNNNAGTMNSLSRDAGQKRQPHNNHQNQNHNHNNANSNNNHMQRGNRMNNLNALEYHHYVQQQSRDRRESGRNNNNNADNYNNHQQHDGNMRGSNYNNYQRGGNNAGRNWNMHRGQQNLNVAMRGRGGAGGNRNPAAGGMGRMPNQNYRAVGGTVGVGVGVAAGAGAGAGGNQNKMRTVKNTIKFEQDFDFEQANNKFEELRSQLTKLKVGEEPKTEQLNGELDKKDDSGNETGAGEQEHEEEEISVGYDKTKSFFDNISCEAAQDRSKNKKNDWRQERKLNSETFGVSSTRRGGYRGRGQFYNNRTGGNYNNVGSNSGVGGPSAPGGGVGGGGGGYGYNRGYRGNNNNYRSRNMRVGGASNNRDGNVQASAAVAAANNANLATAAANNNTNSATSSTTTTGTNNTASTTTSTSSAGPGAAGATGTTGTTATAATTTATTSTTATTIKQSVSNTKPTTPLSGVLTNLSSATPATTASPSTAAKISDVIIASKGATPKSIEAKTADNPQSAMTANAVGASQ